MPRSPTFMSSEIEEASVAKPPSPCSLTSLATSMASISDNSSSSAKSARSAAIALAQSTRICGTALATGLGQLSSFINTSSNVTPLQASSCNHALNNHVASNHRMTSCWSDSFAAITAMQRHTSSMTSTSASLPKSRFLSTKPESFFWFEMQRFAKASGRLSSSIVRSSQLNISLFHFGNPWESHCSDSKS